MRLINHWLRHWMWLGQSEIDRHFPAVGIDVQAVGDPIISTSSSRVSRVGVPPAFQSVGIVNVYSHWRPSLFTSVMASGPRTGGFEAVMLMVTFVVAEAGL